MANGKTLGEATHMPVRIKVAPFLTSMAIPTIPVLLALSSASYWSKHGPCRCVYLTIFFKFVILLPFKIDSLLKMKHIDNAKHR